MYLLYSVLSWGLLVLALPYFLIRSFRIPGYARSLWARFGFEALPASDAPTVWIHAVSVGEVLAARTIIPELKRVFPDARIAVSVITVTGRQVADEKLTDADLVFYCPFDLAFLIRRAVSRLRPTALVVLETEIWPHLLRENHRQGAVTMMAAGRISDRSYPRYRLIRPFMKRVLREIDVFCMQSPLYAERIESLGAPRDRILVTGSMKFDAAPEARESLGLVPSGRKVLIAGSTLSPEESILLDAAERLRADFPELYLVLAPRHPPRFEEAFELARSRGHRVVRRSDDDAPNANADVLILDSLGELARLYRDADVVFVGGSLATWGGHNIIEPAAFGRPVLFGPHMSNFQDTAQIFLDADAAVQVADEASLESELRRLLSDAGERAALGARAERVIEDHRGATARTVDTLKELQREL